MINRLVHMKKRRLGHMKQLQY